MEDFAVRWVWEFRGVSRMFFVCMGWVLGLKSNPHGSPAYLTFAICIADNASMAGRQQLCSGIGSARVRDVGSAQG